VQDLRKAIDDIQFHGEILFDEPMDIHTNFRIGGPADVFLTPVSDGDVAAVMKLGDEYPVFILGAGANILVADAGIRGIVLDMAGLDCCSFSGDTVTACAGAAISDVSRFAAEQGLSGLEFIYSMPGSVGGSVWMNARCYGRSVSEVIGEITIIDEQGVLKHITPSKSDFAYKISPFQHESWAIVRADFNLQKGNKGEIRKAMDENHRDRDGKGHFSAPSVGSIFKNDRRFGMPTGKLADSLSLRGISVGGAQVSQEHANIIVNGGNASAGDILTLITLVETRVRDAYGFELEREVRLVGDWGKEADVGQ
jgi:UDP-N-acetylmuramate dehydrogenase